MDICARIKSGEIRDATERGAEEVSSLARDFGAAIAQALQQPSDGLVSEMQDCMLQILAFSEFAQEAFYDAGESLEQNLALACARAQVCDNAYELPLLLSFSLRIHTFAKDDDERSALRRRANHIAFWANLLSYDGASPMLLKLCLELLRITVKEEDTALALLTQKLLPLHKIQGKLSPTQSLLEGFHRELTICLVALCRLTPTTGWDVCIQALTSTLYPTIGEGNSPKEVLILHELETLVREAGKHLSAKSRACVCTRLLSCISSLHGMVCERALTFWQSDAVFALLQGEDLLLSKMCDAALARASLEHWSPTVRSMAGAALIKSNPLGASSSNALLDKALENAKQVQLARQIVPETMPLPKAFSSTSVIRDALEPFASGAFGVIWRGRAIVPGVGRAQWPLIALKEVDSSELAMREMEAMTRVGSNINLVKFLGTYQTGRTGLAITHHLVLELVEPPPGDLHTVVCERGALSLELTRWFGAQLGNAIQFIHSKQYVFGDVKPENVLISREGVVKLCDFGSCFPAVTGRGIGGTIEYLPPEQLPSLAGDWWAFGCVLHFMLTGKPPIFFNTEEETDLPSAFARAVTFADQRGGVLIKDATCRALVAALCSRDPAERPKDGGESHAFFHQVRPWNTLAEKRLDAFPGLPAPMAASSFGASNANAGGPWQRRTFSTIHSPLPKQYQVGVDAAFIKMACIESTSKGKDLPVKVELAASAPRNLALFEAMLARIPKARVAHVPPPSSNVAGGGRDDVNGGGKIRRVIKKTYNVGGLDLTAG